MMCYAHFAIFQHMRMRANIENLLSTPDIEAVDMNIFHTTRVRMYFDVLNPIILSLNDRMWRYNSFRSILFPYFAL